MVTHVKTTIEIAAPVLSPDDPQPVGVGSVGMWAASLRDFVDGIARQVAAVVAGVLPRRYWRDLEAHLPMRQAAALSGLATMLAGVVIGIPAYFAYVSANASQATTLMLESTGWLTPAANATPVAPEMAQAMWLNSFLAPVTFLVLTPTGLTTAYLFATGFFRAVSAWVDEARGDPLLTLGDSVAVRWREQRASRRAAAARERLEGPAVPDRILTGPQAGMAGAELVVIASRRKPGWEAGVFVITDRAWYRLGAPAERDTPAGLRTLYPLTEVRDQEVLRKGVRYDFPA